MIRLTDKETDTGLGFRFTRCELVRMELACIGAAGYMRRRCGCPLPQQECGATVPPAPPEGMLTTAQAALYTGLPEYTIYNAVQSGALKACHTEGDGRNRNYYPREELDRLVRCRKERRRP